jgi:hypothetical protein
MNTRQRRVRAVELTLTPREVVLVWLREAMQAGTFLEGARHYPPYRGEVANKVLRAVRASMKGQPGPLVERAILQGRREADSLYILVTNANIAVLRDWEQHRREFLFLLGCLAAEVNGNATKNRVEQLLRPLVIVFLESVLMLDGSIAQLVRERLNGQPLLFRDVADKLAEQLQMATDMSTWFNLLAVELGAAEIDLEDLRDSLQSEVERTVTIWVHQARLEMLTLFGEMEETRSALDQHFLLCQPPPLSGLEAHEQ